MTTLVGLEFPPIGHLVEWEGLFLKGTPFEVNKTVLLMWLTVVIVFGLFMAAGRRAAKGAASGDHVPGGVQNVIESGVDFVRESVVLQTIGKDGLGWMPFLATMFFFIFFLNIYEVLPFVQFPVNARMAIPAFLALTVWAIYNVVGVKHQGLGGYIKSVAVPPGVPAGILPLVALIEIISTFVVRPFSLAVRLFANMLAGHLLLVTFAVLCAALWSKTLLLVILPLPFAMLVLLTGFEILVAGLQAFIFTILTAVYIGGAMHPEH